MRRIEVKRQNCIHGYWHENGEEMTAWEIAQHYIVQREGSEKRIRGIEFVPDKEEDRGGHGVFGTLKIRY